MSTSASASVGSGEVGAADVLEPVAQIGLAREPDRGVAVDLAEAERDHAAEVVGRGLVEVAHEARLEPAEEHAFLAERLGDPQEILLDDHRLLRVLARLLAAREVLAVVVDLDAVGMGRAQTAQRAGPLGAVRDDAPAADEYAGEDLVDAFGP